MLDTFSLDTFSTGDELTVQLEEAEPVRLQVAEVLELPGETEARKPFSLLFVGPEEPLLPQQIHSVAHPKIGPFDLFLVPLGPHKEGGFRYEAIFT